MKYFQLALLCFICVAKSHGQAGSRGYCEVDVEIAKEKKPKKIYTKVVIASAFPGGDSSFPLYNLLKKNLTSQFHLKMEPKQENISFQSNLLLKEMVI
jgi:hypothetical protein